MSASYPKAIKTFTTKHDFTDDVNAVDVNDLQDEVKAMQSVLGIMPLTQMNKDPAQTIPWTTVAGRLDALEAGLTKPVFSTWNNDKVQVVKNVVKFVTLDAPSAANDPLGWYNGTTGFRINRTGWYHINGYTLWRANASTGLRRTSLYTSGVLQAVSDNLGPATWSFESNVCLISRLTAGTTVKVGVSHNCSTVQTIGGTKLSGVFLRGV